MANSALQGYEWNIPKELHNHLSRIHTAYKGDKSVEGYKRLKNLIDNPVMSYEQLKRVKNFFDTHKTSKTDYMDDKKQDTQFILNGGSKMRYWVNDTLGKARQNIDGKKQAMMNTQAPGNQYQKANQTKGKISTNNVKINTNQKVSSSARHISNNRGIYEIERMENLINIFEQNKKMYKD